jgi:hypothetical protein
MEEGEGPGCTQLLWLFIYGRFLTPSAIPWGGTRYATPTSYCGFLISANAYEALDKPGIWKASFSIEAGGTRYGATNVSGHPSREDADSTSCYQDYLLRRYFWCRLQSDSLCGAPVMTVFVINIT